MKSLSEINERRFAPGCIGRQYYDRCAEIIFDFEEKATEAISGREEFAIRSAKMTAARQEAYGRLNDLARASERGVNNGGESNAIIEWVKN